MGRDNALKRVYALGRMKAGQMNKTEAAYALHLEAMKQGGEILWYKFEGMKFRLADSTFYTPDFAVMRSDGVLEMHEVKGYMLEDANVKIKVASSMYPIRFLAIYARPKKEGGGWRVDEF
jgi:hypothetical protein